MEVTALSCLFSCRIHERKLAAIDLLLIFHPISLEGLTVYLPFMADLNLQKNWVAMCTEVCSCSGQTGRQSSMGKTRVETSVEDGACPGHRSVLGRDAELGPRKSPAQRSTWLCLLLPSRAEGAPGPGHPWHQAWHGLCTAFSICHSISWLFTSRQNCLQGKKECQLNHKNHLLPEFWEFPRPRTRGAISHAYSPCMVSCGLMYTEFFWQKCYIKCDLSYITAGLWLTLQLIACFLLNVQIKGKCQPVESQARPSSQDVFASAMTLGPQKRYISLFALYFSVTWGESSRPFSRFGAWLVLAEDQSKTPPPKVCREALWGVTPNMGATWVCVRFQALPASLPRTEPNLQPVLAPLLFEVHSAWHPSFNPKGATLLACTDWALWDSVVGKVVYTYSELPFIWIDNCCH